MGEQNLKLIQMIPKFLKGGKRSDDAGKIHSALKELTKAEQEKDFKKASVLYKSAASKFIISKDHNAAIECLQKYFERASGEERFFEMGWAKRELAHVYFESGSDELGIESEKQAAGFFGQSNSFYAVKLCYNDLAKFFEEKGDFVQALKFYTKSNNIEKEKEAEKKIKEILEMISHPEIEESAEHDNPVEGDDVRFNLKLTNVSKEKISKIFITDKDGKTLDTVDEITPGEKKEFSYNVKASGSYTEAPYENVIWHTADGNVFNKKIEKRIIEVDQKIELIMHVSRNLQYAKESYFALGVKNKSSTHIRSVKLHIDFPIELKVKPINGYKINDLEPGSEKSFLFKILPLNVGNNEIEGAYLEYTNDKYEKVMMPINRFSLEEVLENKEMDVIHETDTISENEIKKAKQIHKDKKFIFEILSEKKMDLKEYLELTKKLASETYGYVLKGVDNETVYKHIMEELKGLNVVSSHYSEEHSVMLFSAQSNEGETYLLTVVSDMKNDACNIAYRIYSGNEKGLKEIAERIAEMIKYTIVLLSMAREVEKIEVKEVINIIDSVVQRSKLGALSEAKTQKGEKKIDIKDSVVQRTES